MQVRVGHLASEFIQVPHTNRLVSRAREQILSLVWVQRQRHNRVRMCLLRISNQRLLLLEILYLGLWVLSLTEHGNRFTILTVKVPNFDFRAERANNHHISFLVLPV